MAGGFGPTGPEKQGQYVTADDMYAWTQGWFKNLPSGTVRKPDRTADIVFSYESPRWREREIEFGRISDYTDAIMSICSYIQSDYKMVAQLGEGEPGPYYVDVADSGEPLRLRFLVEFLPPEGKGDGLLYHEVGVVFGGRGYADTWTMLASGGFSDALDEMMGR